MSSSPSPKVVATALARVALRSFLETNCTLDLQPTAEPKVSVLLLLWNRAELTLACLQTLALRYNQTPVEIIVVDNGSTDETTELLERVRGLKIVRNETNLGYPRGVNQAANLASGKFLLMLNNDTEVLGRSIDIASTFLECNPQVGAVGSKVILLDGSLQLAGCSMTRDGWPYLYGEHQPPDDPAFNFQRDVDFCPGAFLMTPRRLYEEMGGLDEAFTPGYFEDVDYCARLWQRGLRVVYLPDAAILHYENASSSNFSDLSGLVKRNHGVFMAKHADWLRHRPTSRCHELILRTTDRCSQTVLVLGDDLVRGLREEVAFQRLAGLVAQLQSHHGLVTLWLNGPGTQTLRPLLRRLPQTVEVFCGEKTCAHPLARRYDLVVAGSEEALAGLPQRGRCCAVYRNGQFTRYPDSVSVFRQAG